MRRPWLPLETRPDSPEEPAMQPRDPCLPWRAPGSQLRSLAVPGGTETRSQSRRVPALRIMGKEMATHSSVLAWRIPGTGQPGGLPSMGGYGTTDWFHIGKGVHQGCIWRRQWHPTPVFLPGKSHGQRSLVGCSPWGRTESDTTERKDLGVAFQAPPGSQASSRGEAEDSAVLSSHGRKPRGPSTCACDLRELLFVPLRTQGYCGITAQNRTGLLR